MTEKLLQFIWQFQYFNHQSLTTAGGEKIVVLHPGTVNKNQGPDFEQARISIHDTTWAGTVELHIRASDWNRHKHQEDARYGKVILHVVWINDIEIVDAHLNPLPALELQSRVSNVLRERYEQWMMTDKQIPCGGSVQQVQPLTWKLWKERLLVERLSAKYQVINQHLAATNNHWEEVFWRMLCRYFGGNINGVSFEQVAVSLPLQVLAKHKNQIHQLEALLLGQAGLLHNRFEEDYPKLLFREYQFLQKKYSLRVINLPPSFLRMRPVSFPTVRLAQLAGLVLKSQHLFSSVREAATLPDIKPLLEVTPNDYWHYHYRFDEAAEYQPKKLGSAMIDSLLINAIVPMVFAYGMYTNDPAMKEKALNWLEKITAEKNSVIAPFASLGVKAENAFDSQALLHLKKHYCDAKKCLDCAVGNSVLKRS